MKKLLAMLAIAASTLLTGCGVGTVAEGNAALVFGTTGKFSGTEGPGLYVKPFQRVDEYMMKEITISFDNLRPKAMDDLSLQDLDVDIAYRVTSVDALKRLALKRTGSSSTVAGADYFFPAYNYVKQTAESEIADGTSKFDSLSIHKSRDALAAAIHKQLQDKLNELDPGDLKKDDKQNVLVPGDIQITRVQVRKALPDASVEVQIRNVVNKEKELEASKLAVQIADENAKATAKTANTLTPAFLQHEYNQVLMKFAENKGGTVILDSSNSSKILNLK